MLCKYKMHKLVSEDEHFLRAQDCFVAGCRIFSVYQIVDKPIKVEDGNEPGLPRAAVYEKTANKNSCEVGVDRPECCVGVTNGFQPR